MIRQYFKLLSSFILFLSFSSVPVKGITTFSAVNSTSENVESIKINSGNISFQQSFKNCECGEYSTKCDFENGRKICKCYFDYADNSGKCEKCECGDFYARCYFESGRKICQCLDGYANNSGTCQKCKCGPNSLFNGCRFVNGEKVCSCKNGYSQDDDICRKCDCGYFARKCEFKNYFKTCTCTYGYVELDGKCTVCDCGPNAVSCSVDNNIRRCVCKKGFGAKPISFIYDNEICASCDCGPGSISCSIDKKGTRSCNCSSRYVAKSSYFGDQTCVLTRSSSFDWKLGTVIEAVIFGNIVVALLIFTMLKKCR